VKVKAEPGTQEGKKKKSWRSRQSRKVNIERSWDSRYSAEETQLEVVIPVYSASVGKHVEKS
jgi:hypothetical protein